MAKGDTDALEVRQMDCVADACRTSAPRPGFSAVPLPGERALKVRAKQLVAGMDLHPGIMPQLTPWAEKLGVTLPATV